LRALLFVINLRPLIIATRQILLVFRRFYTFPATCNIPLNITKHFPLQKSGVRGRESRKLSLGANFVQESMWLIWPNKRFRTVVALHATPWF